MKILKLEKITITKENFLMLDNINLEVKTGNICGIISDNQKALDIFINILCGLENEDSGYIYFMNQKLLHNSRIKNIGIMRQNFNLIDNMTVLENIFLSSSNLYSRYGFINKKLMIKKGISVLEKLQTPINIKLKLKQLNPNEKLMVEIARVLTMDCDYYVFGQITRLMSLRQFEAFVSIIKELKNKGKCIIILPSTAEDVKVLVDKLYLIKNSKLIELENSIDISDDKINELLLSSQKLQIQQVHDPIHKAKMIMEERVMDNNIDFHKVAVEVYMGYENFRRRFKVETGLSPNQYFIKIKMEKAKEMLIYTNLEIKEIAIKLGFDDPYYFSRIFKEKVNLSPVKFRDGRVDYIIE